MPAVPEPLKPGAVQTWNLKNKKYFYEKNIGSRRFFGLF